MAPPSFQAAEPAGRRKSNLRLPESKQCRFSGSLPAHLQFRAILPAGHIVFHPCSKEPPMHIVFLDRDTLPARPLSFNFPHTLHEFPATAPEQTNAHLAGAQIA
ncbi:MAG: hypothetical protein E7I45_04420, partial [Eikenella corrodens]|nr:hypothetical protein [Eikenella corrodens]